MKTKNIFGFVAMVLLLAGTVTALYQEDADQTNCVGNFCDGNWNTPELGPSRNFLNYTKPECAIGAEWIVRGDIDDNFSMSIPDNCWNYDANKLILQADIIGGESQSWLYCFDGTNSPFIPFWYALNENNYMLYEDGIEWLLDENCQIPQESYDTVLNLSALTMTFANTIISAPDSSNFSDGFLVTTKITPSQLTHGYLVSKNKVFLLQITADKYIQGGVWNGNTWTPLVQSQNKVVAGTTYDITFGYDEEMATLLINGILVDSESRNINLNSPSNNILIGNAAALNRGFVGTMTELTVLSR